MAQGQGSNTGQSEKQDMRRKISVAVKFFAKVTEKKPQNSDVQIHLVKK